MTDAIEPTQVWTAEEWREQQPWGGMPNSPLRRMLKEQAFLYIYSGGPGKLSDYLDE